MRARTSQRRCAGAFLSSLSTALLLGRYSSPIPRADDCICRLPFPPPEKRDYASNDPARRHLSAIRHTRRAFPLCCMLRATLRPSCGKYRAACRKRPRALRSCLFMKASSVQNLATPHICALSVQTSWVRCSQCVCPARTPQNIHHPHSDSKIQAPLVRALYRPGMRFL